MDSTEEMILTGQDSEVFAQALIDADMNPAVKLWRYKHPLNPESRCGICSTIFSYVPYGIPELCLCEACYNIYNICRNSCGEDTSLRILNDLVTRARESGEWVKMT